MDLFCWGQEAPRSSRRGCQMSREQQNKVAIALGAFVAAVMLFLVLAQGCNWREAASATLRGLEQTIETGDKAGLAYYERRCMDLAKKCPPGSTAATCSPLGECWGQRKLLQAVLDRSAIALAAAWTAAAVGTQEQFKDKLAVLKSAIGDLTQMLDGGLP